VETLSREITIVCAFALCVQWGSVDPMAQSDPAKILVGDNKVQALASYQGSDPLPKPFVVVIVVVTVVIERIKRAQKGRGFETKE
jgi:hypothetical protein